MSGSNWDGLRFARGDVFAPFIVDVVEGMSVVEDSSSDGSELACDEPCFCARLAVVETDRTRLY